MNTKLIKVLTNIENLVASFTKMKNYEDLIEEIKTQIDFIAPNDTAGLYLFDEIENKLKLFYAKGFSKEEIEIAEQTAMDRHPGFVFKTGEVLWTNDQENKKNVFSIDSIVKSPTLSRLYVPVKSNNTIIGTFGIRSEKTFAFDETHVAILKVFASLAGEAIIQIKNSKEIENNKKIIEADYIKIKKSEEQYNNIIETSHDLISVIDGTGVFEFVNNTWLTIMGYELNEVVGTNIFNYIHPDSQVHCMSFFKDLHSQQQKKLFVEYSLINKEGNKIDVSGNLICLHENEKILTINSFLSDITEINKIKNDQALINLALNKSEVKNERILNSLNETIWGVSLPNYKLEYISESAVQLYELPLENWKNNINLWAEVIHPDDQKRVNEESAKLFEQGETNLEYRILTPDKKVKWIYSNTKILKDDQGVPNLMTGISGDISVRKQIESDLKDYKIAIDESSIVSIADRKGIITYVNQKFCSASKYSKEELIGNNHNKLNSQFHPKEYFVNMWNTILSGEIWRGEIKNKAKDGSFYWVQTTIIPFLKDGKPYQYVSIRHEITENVKIKLEIKKQKNFYETILNNIPGNVAVFDRHGNYVFINPHTVKDPVLRDWLIGKNNYDYCKYRGISMDFADERNKQFELLHENGRSITSIEKKMEADGTYSYMNSLLNIIEFNNEKLIIAYALDITEIKNAENEISRLKYFYETILDHLPSDIAIFDTDHKYLYLNKAAIKDENLRKHIIGKDDFEYAAYRGREATGAIERREKFLESKQSKQMVTWEDEICVSNGSKITILRKFYPVMEDENNLKLMIGYGVDITSIKENQLKVIKNEAKINSIMRSALDAIVIINSKGKITYTNPAVFNIFGFEEQEMLNKHIIDSIIPAKYVAELYNDLRNYSNSGKSQILNTLMELPAKRKDGVEILIELSIIPIEIDGETSFCSFIGDITKKKEAEIKIADLNKNLEEKVTQRTKQLEAAIKELDSFSYSISHDLKAPLRGIAGYSSALLEDYRDQLDEQGIRFINRISDSTTRMNTLIDDLLTLSKIGRYDLSKSNVELTELSKDIFYRVLETHSRNDVELKIEPNLMLNCDKNLFTIALTNLISNAIKFSSKKETPIVEIGSIANPAGTIFYIKDNGAGFDIKFAEKLFGAFQRLHTQSDFEGTGIGLATVMRIINMHEGKI